MARGPKSWQEWAGRSKTFDDSATPVSENIQALCLIPIVSTLRYSPGVQVVDDACKREDRFGSFMLVLHGRNWVQCREDQR